MTAYEALDKCPEMMFVHVSTLVDEKGEERMIESSVVKVTKIREPDGVITAQKIYRVEKRDKDEQKVSLLFYREESKKIFQIIDRYANVIEKAGCDEAFLNVTQQVNFRYNLEGSKIDYKKHDGTKDFWEGAYFMSFLKG